MRQRIVTGIVGGAAFLLFVWLGGYWFSAVIFLLAVLAYFEYLRMKGIKWYELPGLIGTGLLFFLLIQGGNELLSSYGFIVLWLFLFLLMTVPVFSKNRHTVFDIGYLLLGALYIGLGFHYMMATRNLPDGLEWTLLAIACVWATDTGAYFSGRFFGRKKLWPEISPKKTVEGAVGGTIMSVVAAFLFFLFGDSLKNFPPALLTGVVIAVAAQFGDLIESAIKRAMDVKDSGAILPGHGGILDRFDSNIAVFPIVYFLIPYISG